MTYQQIFDKLTEMEQRLREQEQRIQEQEQRIQDQEDFEAVRQLMYKYVNCLAFLRFDEMVTYFADDCIMDVGLDDVPPLVGIEAIKERFINTISKGHTGEDGPVIEHPILTKEGDIIKGNMFLYVHMRYTRTGQAMFWLQNVYNNEYKKVNGEWKISKLSMVCRLGLPGNSEPPYLGC